MATVVTGRTLIRIDIEQADGRIDLAEIIRQKLCEVCRDLAGELAQEHEYRVAWSINIVPNDPRR